MQSAPYTNNKQNKKLARGLLIGTVNSIFLGQFMSTTFPINTANIGKPADIPFRSSIDFQQQVLGLRAKRQEILAGNIANADTPTYKARDIDFGANLRAAIKGRAEDKNLNLTTTSARHLQGTNQIYSKDPELLYRVPAQMSADGNTVEMDHERNQFAENAIRYNASVGFVSGSLKTLMSAVQGQ